MLELQGNQIRLYGVEGVRGRPAREFQRYLGRREVVCEPIADGNEHRCRVDDKDLSRVVLFNGGGARPDLLTHPEKTPQRLHALAGLRESPLGPASRVGLCLRNAAADVDAIGRARRRRITRHPPSADQR
jgi:hypothetical protein